MLILSIYYFVKAALFPPNGNSGLFLSVVIYVLSFLNLSTKIKPNTLGIVLP